MFTFQQSMLLTAGCDRWLTQLECDHHHEQRGRRYWHLANHQILSVIL